MANLLKWDQIGERTYETGVDQVVLYPQKDGAYPVGVAWNGITSINENPSGAEDNPFYADNIKYVTLKSAEELGFTIECFTYPPEWKQCNGEEEIAAGVVVSQQNRNTFGLCYRTKIGNDTENIDHGYTLHLLYGASASPSEKGYQTINDSPEPIAFSYEGTTIPIPVTGYKPTSSISIDSTKADKTKLEELEKILYGVEAVTEGETTSDEVKARLPLPDEIVEMFAEG